MDVEKFLKNEKDLFDLIINILCTIQIVKLSFIRKTIRFKNFDFEVQFSKFDSIEI